MKVVADTNVYVSATLSEGKPYRVLELAESGRIELVTSLDIIDEVEDVLGRDKIPFDDEQVQRFVQKVLSLSTVVAPEVDLEVVDDDPDDDKILECAADSGADYILSGDSHLLDLGSYDGIDVVDPAEFVDTVDERY